MAPTTRSQRALSAGAGVKKPARKARRERGPDPGCAVCKTISDVIHGSKAGCISYVNAVEVLDQNCKKHSTFMRPIFRAMVRQAMSEDLTIAEHDITWDNESSIALVRIPGLKSMIVHFQNIRQRQDLQVFWLYIRSLTEFNVPQPSSRKVTDPSWFNKRLLRGWKNACVKSHTQCQKSLSPGLSDKHRPLLLIDCWLQKLVTGSQEHSYVALSYVWGGIEMLQTLQGNLESLLLDHALAAPDIRSRLPVTIRNAMELTTLLGERYLWVDALCIVQDAKDQKHSEIGRMPGIYYNATLTIVSQGRDANSGLPGIPNISRPRVWGQARCSFGSKDNYVISENTPWTYKTGAWDSRGWTFQEGVFSRRMLVFHNETVSWCCRHSIDSEDGQYLAPIDDRAISISGSPSSNVPKVRVLFDAVESFTCRNFTYPEDAYYAFYGIMFTLSQTYSGGFISGCPMLFFHEFLLWIPGYRVRRRAGAEIALEKPQQQAKRLPSWSWMGWSGRIFWYRNIVYGSVEWRYLEPRTNTWLPIESDPHDYRALCNAGSLDACPSGWSRHCDNNDGTEFFTHQSDPDEKFRFPVPLPNVFDEAPQPSLVQLIACKTRTASAYAASESSSLYVNLLRDQQEVCIGWVDFQSGPSLDSASEPRPPQVGTLIELVEISRERMQPHFRDWAFEAREEEGSVDKDDPADCKEFRNVLYVTWSNGIAERQGIGRIAVKRWEALDLKEIDLYLG